ncbi:NAD(P)-binding domain-containing protein [Labrys monachus]|uniref:Ornithine cyclodeaminase n=1 Tax=Labrys monachus TaxID=217067 RepID=A0ABU0F8A0_9HYPH|nr:NAD(P)-binding domain-containing protein [Labrys monachus]MDQ0390800.1 ornithine cyclodeaminase [Labrys monachus]
MRLLTPEAIRAALDGFDPVPAMEAAFRAFSRGEAVVPPPGELLFQDPPGDVHIKYGHIAGGDYYVVKIASGFYDNPRHGLPSGNGLVLAFRRRTGEPAAILDDRGYLTDLRTAAAGAVAARHLAPAEIDAIGIIGTGMQAEMQVLQLQSVRPCRDVVVWGRRPEAARDYAERLGKRGFSVTIAASPAEVAERCRLIVTATPSAAVLLERAMVRPGTHVTAIGADTPDKQELDPALFGAARVVAVDSRAQGALRGDLRHALAAGAITLDRVVELGEIIDGRAAGRTDESEITVAALTGLAVQDVAIASAVLARASGGPG